MKLIIASFALLSTFSCYSQEEADTTEIIEEVDSESFPETRFDESTKLENPNSTLNGLYIWNNAILMVRCNAKGASVLETDDDQTYLSQTGQQFRVIQSNDSLAVIQILNYTDGKNAFIKEKKEAKQAPFLKYNADVKGLPKKQEEVQSIVKSNDFGSAQKYFKVKTKDITAHATEFMKISPSLAFGLLNLPFKARIQSGKADFSGSLNINNAIGITYGHKSWRKFIFSTILSYGISSTVIDSLSVSRNHNRLTSSNTFPTLTLAVGQVVTFDKVQIGVFIGMDRLSRQNQDTYGWTYNGDPWLSVGFGYSIFSIEKENAKKKEVTQ
ncbi:MAG: hypothetical protein HWE22_10040 [Flavobacteriales bacterium]|nr:hypothetical protein [Flavobacteriales bacterium]